jgi:kynurenine formamidase
VNLGHVRLLDLSVVLGPSPSEQVPVQIEYLSHEMGGCHLAELTGVAPADLTGGLGWASERVCSITHSGTHVDAPFHYSPTCAGRRSLTIDALPVEWFLGPGVCIQATGPPADAVQAAEVAEFEARHRLRIGPGTIVLFHTGAGRAYGSEAYGECGRGLSPAAVASLCGRGVRVIGTDAWSLDPPLSRMRERAAREGGTSVWQAHYAGREHEFCAVEKLANLELLPAVGFYVACFPVKVARGSAGWTRAVAILPAGDQA